MTEGDPLGLVEATALRLRQLAILQDVDQVHARVVARAAHEGVLKVGESGAQRPGPQHLEHRLNRWIDRAVEELADEDRVELGEGGAAYEAWDPRHTFLTRALGLSGEGTRRGCVAFNGLRREVRRSFFGVVIEGLSAEVVAEREGLEERTLVAEVVEAFVALVGPGTRARDTAPANRDHTRSSFIDPAVAAELERIGQCDRAELHGIRDPRALPGVAGLVDAEAVRCPPRPVLERHLARIAQHDVAWLMRQAVLTRLFSDPETRRFLHRGVHARRRHRPLNADTIRGHLRRFRDLGQPFAAFEPQLNLIGSALGDASSSVVSIETLAQASHDLCPSAQPLICLAFDRIARGELTAGEVLLMRLWDNGLSDLSRSIVEENLGLASALRGDLREAAVHYRASADAARKRVGPVISWVHACAQARDADQLLQAATRLDDLAPPEHAAVVERCQPTCDVLDESRVQQGEDTVESVRHLLGPTSLSVTDAYFAQAPRVLCSAATVGPVEAELLE